MQLSDSQDRSGDRHQTQLRNIRIAGQGDPCRHLFTSGKDRPNHATFYISKRLRDLLTRDWLGLEQNVFRKLSLKLKKNVKRVPFKVILQTLVGIAPAHRWDRRTAGAGAWCGAWCGARCGAIAPHRLN